MVILSAMLGLAACRADTGSHINNTGAGAENHGMQDNTSAPDSFGSQEGNREPDSSSVPDHDADQPWEDEPRRGLTEEELRGFEKYLNRIDNYGFLMSDYGSPEYINLNEVFYSRSRPGTVSVNRGRKGSVPENRWTAGALHRPGEAGYGADERVSHRENRTDAGTDENRDWVDLPGPYDRYYAEHGDTNIRSFFCPSGEKDGGIYRIRCLFRRIQPV